MKRTNNQVLNEQALLMQVMTLHQSGLLDIVDRRSGNKLWSVGPFSGCSNPYKLILLANGQLVLQDKSKAVIWSTASACRGNPTCYT